ncbi:hypothetical protein GQ44DRAFT_705186 [Phaeosphaeriaceae sp. PMI808]|nr:hypothetical protein GQ44DRAFT_705186 [Phaeosphaeriaceae sp. PMI808]
MELALIEAFVTAIDRGWRADSGYKAEAWAYAVQQVARVTGRLVDKSQCRNKYNALKKD